MLVGRSQAKTAAVADELGAPYHLADYADLDQVRNLATELQATYPRISAAAFHPGVVATNFASDTTHIMRRFYHSPLKHLFTITPAKGAEPLVWLAEGAPGTWQSGGYYEKNKPAKTNVQADDTRLAEQLWERSADLLELKV